MADKKSALQQCPVSQTLCGRVMKRHAVFDVPHVPADSVQAAGHCTHGQIDAGSRQINLTRWAGLHRGDESASPVLPPTPPDFTAASYHATFALGLAVHPSKSWQSQDSPGVPRGNTFFQGSTLHGVQ